MKKITLFFALLLFSAFNYTAQAVESQTAACTVGNLATVAASYLNTVTNLTVTGTIDARDFKTMSDVMPLLEEIDLSGSTVVAYTGTGGTGGNSLINYRENEIPILAFSGEIDLKAFVFPSLVSSIGEWAFENCIGLTGSLNIPSTVTTIRDGAFSACHGFKGSLNIPSSVISIGKDAFYACHSFTGVVNNSTIGNNNWP